MSKIRLYYHPAMQALAEAIVKLSLGKIRLYQITWDVYPDKTPKITIPNAGGIRNRDCLFLASTQPPASLRRQQAVVYTIAKTHGARSVKFLCPYFSSGTQDRDDVPGQVPMGVIDAKSFGILPQTQQGPVQIVIVDLHARSTLYAFPDGVHVRDESAVHLFRSVIEDSGGTWAIAFPDKGARARYAHRFTKHDQVLCIKIRDEKDPQKRVVKIEKGDPKGKKCVIIDDLGRSGNTLIECARTVKKKGATYVVACISHGVFSGGEWEKFTQSDCPVDELWMTDSCPWTMEAIADHLAASGSRIRVFSLATMLTQIALER